MLLARGLAPITDNRDALLELGFERSYPQVTKGHESTVWERTIDHGYRNSAGGVRRVMARQRAFLRPSDR